MITATTEVGIIKRAVGLVIIARTRNIPAPATRGKEIPKQKIITPTAICQKYQVRMFVANEIIKELVKSGAIVFHQKTAYTNLYKPAKE